MQSVRTLRLHVGIYGRRNVGKSSLLNAIMGQQTVIVSDVPGTTTDPVERSIELPLLGPVTFIDTGGLDDEGALGAMRVTRTRQTLQRIDVALVVTDWEWGELEAEILSECRAQDIPVIIIRNKCDDLTDDAVPVEPANIAAPVIPPAEDCSAGGDWPADEAVLRISCKTGAGLIKLRQALLQAAPDHFVNRPGILSDLVPPRSCVLLVTPIDKAAPRGRLIMPQVQTIRELLDHHACAMVVRESELEEALEMLAAPPALVVTDSQVFSQVAAETPSSVLMTSFSILFARYQADLATMVSGAAAIDRLRPGDRVLVAEACAHHPSEEDIARVKIPRWLTNHLGGAPDFTFARGTELPDTLADFKLVIHCGACMWTRRQMLSRLELCRQAGVPVTNFGMAIAYSLGIFERALQPFPEALEVYYRQKKSPANS
jgi:[FeFe] hydrogenase H-cluster maturation GTPase HydF